MDHLCYFCLVLLCFHARLFVDALWWPAGKGLTSWLSFVMSNCDVVTFPLVSWVRCGVGLYRFLIFALFLTFLCICFVGIGGLTYTSVSDSVFLTKTWWFHVASVKYIPLSRHLNDDRIVFTSFKGAKMMGTLNIDLSIFQHNISINCFVNRLNCYDLKSLE